MPRPQKLVNTRDYGGFAPHDPVTLGADTNPLVTLAGQQLTVPLWMLNDYQRVIVVDQSGRGDYTLLSAALAGGIAGATSTNRYGIAIMPGYYDEGAGGIDILREGVDIYALVPGTVVIYSTSAGRLLYVGGPTGSAMTTVSQVAGIKFTCVSPGNHVVDHAISRVVLGKFSNCEFELPDTATGSNTYVLYGRVASGTNVRHENCKFIHNALTTATRTLMLVSTTGVGTVVFSNCYIENKSTDASAYTVEFSLPNSAIGVEFDDCEVASASSYSFRCSNPICVANIYEGRMNRPMLGVRRSRNSVTVDSTPKIINVRASEFGAVGDGVTDDRPAFDRAVDVATAIGGGQIYVPAGTYLVSANPSTPTNNIACAIRLPKCTTLVGDGMHASIIKLANGANVSVVSNYLSTDGVETNGQFVSVRNLKIDGNGTNQAGTSHCIHWQVYPLTTKATNDLDYDSHQLVENVMLYAALTNGYFSDGRSENRLKNVYAYLVGNRGFWPNYDTFLEQCTSAWSGEAGFYVANTDVRLVGCKAFYAGQVHASQGHGFWLKGNFSQLTACSAQDNMDNGFLLDGANGCVLSACSAQSNSTRVANADVGFDFWSATHNILQACSTVEFRASNTQQYGLRLRNGSEDNIVDLTHVGIAPGSIVAACITGTTVMANNHLMFSTGARTFFGAGSPEGVVVAPIGSLYGRTDGAAGTTLYVKESGVGSAGWVAK